MSCFQRLTFADTLPSVIAVSAFAPLMFLRANSALHLAAMEVLQSSILLRRVCTTSGLASCILKASQNAAQRPVLGTSKGQWPCAACDGLLPAAARCSSRTAENWSQYPVFCAKSSSP